jgi:hypothetical protein
MKIAMTGATGFVGQHLGRALEERGHPVIAVGRQDFREGATHLASLMEGCEAVIHLAGAPISRRWTAAYKRELVSSRVGTTRLLVEAMNLLDQPPRTLISTSGIGAFDTRGRYTELDEPNATDFLGRLSRDWEAAAREAEGPGLRVVIFRFAVVLGHDGGMMKQILPPFRLGLGGPIGNGRQIFSWIHIDDLVAAELHALEHEEMSGVYHLSAPNPVTNKEFTRTLGRALNRPTVLPVPSPMLKLAFGEGADVMTSGQHVTSTRLPESGFEFRYPDLPRALEAIVSDAAADRKS